MSNTTEVTVRVDWGAIKGLKKKVAGALYKEGQILIAKSVPQVPVDTGALRGSHFVEQPKVDGTKITVALGYGGTATKVNPATGEATADYAVRVHEDLNTPHKVGNAKFLEKPAREYASQFKSNMKRRIEE